MFRNKKVQSLFGLLSLVFVFIVVMTVNAPDRTHDKDQVPSRNSEVRGPDSVPPPEALWQKQLAAQISEIERIPSGKSARAPNAIEKFLFGELKGYYLMELRGERVQEMTLRDNEVADAPQFLGSELKFLEKYKDMWWLDFHQMFIENQSSTSTEVSLRDQANHVVGRALFTWGQHGRLLSLRIDQP